MYINISISNYYMKNLIEIIGVPGAGKTFYLNKINNPKIKCIDFGTEFKIWITKKNKKYSGEWPPKKYVKEFIDLLKNQNTPLIITSHVVHYRNNKFFYAFDYEIYTRASAHIFIYSDPKDILSRIKKDYQDTERAREILPLYKIKKHQDLSLEKTKQLSAKLGSELLILENAKGKETENILQIKKLVEDVNSC